MTENQITRIAHLIAETKAGTYGRPSRNKAVKVLTTLLDLTTAQAWTATRNY